MKLILHEMAHSPFCIPVKRILEAYSVPFEVNPVPPWDRRALAELTAGAYYQVPVIECDRGIIHETGDDPLAVAHFLDTECCGGDLFPASCTGLQELVIDHVENTLEGKGFKLSDPFFVDDIGDLGERTMVIRHKERSFGSGCVEEWRRDATRLLAEFEDALAPFENRLGHSTYLFGDRPVYADYALFGILGNFRYGGHCRLDESLENLIRFQESLSGFSAK